MSHRICYIALVAFTAAFHGQAAARDATEPIVGESVIFHEVDGLIAVEAEHFFRQTRTDVRAFYLISSQSAPHVEPDGDPSHAAEAAGGAYLEALPDTRRTHDDELIRGENFHPEPGDAGVLSYRVRFANPGKYYVWVRAYSTGTEDNGLHVGIDGEWPESGRRLQWCEGKRTWRWDCRQRTQEQHCGVELGVYLDVEDAGDHIVQFSMREDGFEFDKWLMTKDRDFERPTDGGPTPVVAEGRIPALIPTKEP